MIMSYGCMCVSWDRSYTVDELNRSIDKLCRENNINIAFNQLEVYLHNQDGSEVQEVKRVLRQPGDQQDHFSPV